ncbi:uncharacterized protein LOC113273387 [Papaver somniferum]|uniref:uncharacterized protein LOC113273387 n=1 Tax=Papaver somniferum TaxID=3469 RepID=UPI000E7052C3|nr:uncharacterized protein LOC113273387 [Papaver somniferum]
MGDESTIMRAKEFTPPSIQCPILNATNYTVWAMKMKILMKIYKVWETIEPGTEDVDKNNISIGLLFQAIPESLVLQVGEQETSKKIWDAIKARNLGADRLVKKFFNSLPRSKYIQIIASLEQVLDLKRTSYEDIIGRLKAYEEILDEGNNGETQGKLLYTNSYQQNSTTTTRGTGRGRGGRGSRGRERGGRCDKPGHFSSVCPERIQKLQEANKNETEEEDTTLFMHEVVFLNEEKLIPKNYETKDGEEGVWYLDNGASNHMTGKRHYFSELNEKIKGKVKFGDGSYVEIERK